MKSRRFPSREGQGPSGPRVGRGLGDGPTPALHDRRRYATAVAAVKASQAFTPSKEGIFKGVIFFLERLTLQIPN